MGTMIEVGRLEKRSLKLEGDRGCWIEGEDRQMVKLGEGLGSDPGNGLEEVRSRRT